MDKLESLSNTISQITLYDIKSMYNQAKNMVMNVSETEAKVREATNDDPWGASSTLMQEIAQGTFNFHQFNEIMPCIYSRFMEKEARQWRQIYKALQLLEHLIKHGSERVVDDARAHISTLKMLRNFHYIDERGKDEGLNVRNRARELVELLSDVEKIRAERRKAKSNRHKYVGTGNDGFGLSLQSSGSRYGGFGNESLSSNNDFYRSGVGSSTGGFRDDSRRGGFEEYDAGDDEEVHKRPTPSNTSASRNKATPPEPAPAPVVDLLGGLDDALNSTTTTTAAAVSSPNKALPAVNIKQTVGLDDDDFADFQAAPVQVPTLSEGVTTAPMAPVVPVAPSKPNLMDLLNARPNQPSITAAGFTQTPVQQPSLFSSPTVVSGVGTTHRPSASISSILTPLQPTQTGNSITSKTSASTVPLRPTSVALSSRPTATTQSKPSSNFDDLWSMSLNATSKPATPSSGAKSIKDLEKEKSQATLWGAQSKPKPVMSAMSNANTFGSFGAASFGTGTQSSSNADDLLL